MAKAVNPEVLDLLRLQEDDGEEGEGDELISSAELSQAAKDLEIKPRTLSYYIQEGVIPQGLRVGRAAAYPRKVVDLLVYIARARQRGFSMGAIKKMKAVWLMVEHANKTKLLNLNRLQKLAHLVDSGEDEALFSDVLSGLGTCPRCEPGHPTCIEMVVRRDNKMVKIDSAKGFELHLGLNLDGELWHRRTISLKEPEIDPNEMIVFNAGEEPRVTELTALGFRFKAAGRKREGKRARPDADTLSYFTSKVAKEMERVAPGSDTPTVVDLTEALKRSLNEVKATNDVAPTAEKVASAKGKKPGEVSDRGEEKGA